MPKLSDPLVDAFKKATVPLSLPGAHLKLALTRSTMGPPASKCSRLLPKETFVSVDAMPVCAVGL
eukprot:9413306-Pyramimonas_sp.AAC.1